MTKKNDIKLDRIGEHSINTQGIDMEIIEYRNNRDIDVKFFDGTIVQHIQYYTFKIGNVLNHNIPSYLGVGYIGYGKY